MLVKSCQYTGIAFGRLGQVNRIIWKQSGTQYGLSLLSTIRGLKGLKVKCQDLDDLPAKICFLQHRTLTLFMLQKV